MKVFILESPNPNDLLDGRNEAESLVSICKMFYHKATSFFIKNRNELNDVLKYITDVKAVGNDIFCYHFSCHGNSDGLWFGPDFINWDQFAITIMPILENRTLMNRCILVISACGANEQDFTKKISKLEDEAKNAIAPPSYLFVYDDDDVVWKDALLSWTILYHRLSNAKQIEKEDMQELLENMKIVEFGKLIYYRWDLDKKKYLRFRPADEVVSGK
jgi:hypothetical protein